MMQCIVQREKLLEALHAVVGVVETRQTLPILSHALIEVNDSGMTVQCTDNEMSITSHAPIEQVKQPGRITVAASTLLDIARRLPSLSTIALHQKDSQVLLKSDSSHFRLMSLSALDFPSTTVEKDGIAILVSEKLLYQAIKTTQFAMAQNNPRYYLNGMLWEIAEGQLHLVATDAHRLAKHAIPVESSEHASMIVPRKTIIELGKLLSDSAEESLKIHFTEKQLYIKGRHYELTSRLIAGAFPDYKNLLPATENRTAIVSRDAFRAALSKLMPLLKQEMYKGVKLDFTNHFLKLRVTNSKQETGEESLSIQYMMEEEDVFSIAFNIEYLDKILEVLPAGAVKISLPLQEGVTLIQQYTDAPSMNHVYLIMPILL